MKTTLVLQKFLDNGVVPPSKFYVKNLYGDYIFIHAKTLKEAQQFAREQYPASEVESSKLAHKLMTRT